MARCSAPVPRVSITLMPLFWLLPALYSISNTSFGTSPSRKQPTRSVLFFLSSTVIRMTSGIQGITPVCRSFKDIARKYQTGSISVSIHANIRLLSCQVKVDVRLAPVCILSLNIGNHTRKPQFLHGLAFGRARQAFFP